MKTEIARFARGMKGASSLPATVTDQKGTKAALDDYSRKKGLHMDCSVWKRRMTK